MQPFTFRANHYPELPGCYLMLGDAGQVLYVGKAVNLRSRLSSYFRGKHDRIKTARLVQQIREIEIMIVSNENESLTLERELIKHYVPPFNRAMRRGPSVLPYIAVSSEDLPRLTAIDIARFEHSNFEGASNGTKGDTALIGPFPNVPYRNIVLEHVIGSFGLPTCSPMEDRICLRFYQKLCSGICENRITQAQYSDAVRAASELLVQPEAILEHMRAKMEAYAEQLHFEHALQVKKQLEALARMNEKQSVNRPSRKRETIVWIGGAHGLIAQLEEGTLRSRFVFVSLPGDLSLVTAIVQLLEHVWMDTRPYEIITNAGSLDPLVLNEARVSNPNMRLISPKKGRKRDLLDICRVNFEYRVKVKLGE